MNSRAAWQDPRRALKCCCKVKEIATVQIFLVRLASQRLLCFTSNLPAYTTALPGDVASYLNCSCRRFTPVRCPFCSLAVACQKVSMISSLPGVAHQPAIVFHCPVPVDCSQRCGVCNRQPVSRRPCPLHFQPGAQRRIGMPLRGRQLVVAATPESGGGWLSQWFQGMVQGQKGKAGAKGAVRKPVDDRAPKPAKDTGAAPAHRSSMACLLTVDLWLLQPHCGTVCVHWLHTPQHTI